MPGYRFTEHGRGYATGRTLRSWRPQFPIILSWVPKGSKILDVGCADGVLGQKLIKEKSCKVFGIDLDPVGVREAKKKGINAKVFNFDDPLPYKNNSYDIVLASDVLQYSQTPANSIQEWLRVGKKLILYFPNFGFWAYRVQLILGRFPSLSLYGHTWYNTRQTRFFSLMDVLSLPAVKKAHRAKLVCIDWKNRKISLLARLNPNFFGCSCPLLLEKKKP